MLRTEVIGDATLHLGDCRDYICAQTIPAWAGVVCDPPYGIDYQSGHATEELWSGGDAIEGDQDIRLRDQVLEWLDCPALIFGSWKRPRPLRTRMVLIWDKGGALGMGDLRIPWKPDHEEVYVLGDGFMGTRNSGSVIRCPPVQSMAKNGRVHPTQKPVELLMRLCAKVPGPIFDPFMGSGSTGVAAIKLGKRFVGCEINPRYFEIACERVAAAWAQPRLFADTADCETPDLANVSGDVRND